MVHFFIKKEVTLRATAYFSNYLQLSMAKALMFQKYAPWTHLAYANVFNTKKTIIT